MGKREADVLYTDATVPFEGGFGVLSRGSEQHDGFTPYGAVERRAAPAHRRPGDIVFRGFNAKTQRAKTWFVPLLED